MTDIISKNLIAFLKKQTPLGHWLPLNPEPEEKKTLPTDHVEVCDHCVDTMNTLGTIRALPLWSIQLSTTNLGFMGRVIFEGAKILDHENPTIATVKFKPQHVNDIITAFKGASESIARGYFDTSGLQQMEKAVSSMRAVSTYHHEKFKTAEHRMHQASLITWRCSYEKDELLYDIVVNGAKFAPERKGAENMLHKNDVDLLLEFYPRQTRTIFMLTHSAENNTIPPMDDNPVNQQKRRKMALTLAREIHAQGSNWLNDAEAASEHRDLIAPHIYGAVRNKSVYKHIMRFAKSLETVLRPGSAPAQPSKPAANLG